MLVPILPMAACFAAFCLIDLARADRVRYLPKWGWALVCLIEIPLGGIIYLSIGRVRGPHRAAPESPGPAAAR
jgi:Phospholipase_D-nuclease N-terminal